MEIGIYSFAETAVDPVTGAQLEAGSRLRNLLEEIELADQVGLDVFGVGEHHRPDYSVSAPAIVLAAAASRTKRIRLTSAVTVLSSDDPVRVFQHYSTIDLISGGRAEIMAGRGSFIESFPLFGQDLADYDELFAEKLDLLLQLRESERITWAGKHRPPIQDRAVYPRPLQNPLPVWIAVGGTPQSVVRAARLGLPIALAIIGGTPARFKPVVDLYREVGARAGHDPERLKVSINSHGFIAEDRARARELAYPPFLATMNRIGRERGWPPITPHGFDAEANLHGALFLGSPDEVIEKILYQYELFRHDRFLIQLTVGPMPHAEVLRAIELLGTRVAPVVRKETAKVQGQGEG
ncbi:MAG TPA: LLM class flavin-dependent oxidoreductase [Longimicrobiales bacterium]|nr:LLM class flavin-dependent oxidoreductase [Longimicrobiales bacterium]